MLGAGRDEKGLQPTPHSPIAKPASRLLKVTIPEICGHVYLIEPLSICKAFSLRPAPVKAPLD